MVNGWKKSNQKNKWTKKNDSLEIINNFNGEYYTVEIFLFETKDELAKWLVSRRFRTEKMALSHAKKYMRSH